VVDLEPDGQLDIVVGRSNEVIAYNYNNASGLSVKWRADTTSGGNSPEVRGLSCSDLNPSDADGVEVVASTTQTVDESNGGSQLFVFNSAGSTFAPSSNPLSVPAWPRYNYLLGSDRDRNGAGNHGYGMYGLNTGIINLDDDNNLEILATYDNHQIQLFKYYGYSVDASSYYTDRSTGNNFTLGQFIRWYDETVEDNQYHFHTGNWPNPGTGQELLQFTASPPSGADLDGDGRNEIICVSNVEKDIPYDTKAYAVVVLDGNYAAAPNRLGRRKVNWETYPRGNYPMKPGGGIPSPAIVDLIGDSNLEIIVSLQDGAMYCFSANSSLLWRYNFQQGKSRLFSTEPLVYDLNDDGSPEVIFATWGSADVLDSGYLIILGANGEELSVTALENPGARDGNGNGSPAFGMGDLDGNGEIEIFVQTFEHGMDVYNLPNSKTNCSPWPAARGGNLRKGNID
jgi:hypothetical protein